MKAELKGRKPNIGVGNSVAFNKNKYNSIYTKMK